MCCLVGNFCGPGGCGHWGFQVKCVSGFWELTLKKGDVLEVLNGFTGERRAECSTRICFFSLPGMEVESAERLPQKVCYRAWGETGRLDLEEQRERRKSIVNLPFSLAGVACGFSGSTCWIWELG